MMVVADDTVIAIMLLHHLKAANVVLLNCVLGKIDSPDKVKCSKEKLCFPPVKMRVLEKILSSNNILGKEVF